MKKTIYILTILTLVFNVTFGQSNKRANKKYNNFSYVESTKVLLELVESGNTTPEVLQKLGNAYYFNAKMEEASKWYKVLLSQDDTVVEYEYYYRYAMSLKALGNYEEANKYMTKFAELKPEDMRSVLFVKSKRYLERIEELSAEFELNNLDFNSRFSDFGTSFYKGGIVFASSRGDGKLYQWNKQPFLDLYYKADSSTNVIPLSKKINTKYHESSTSFTKDGLTMYYTRNNYYKGKTRESSEKVNGLKIFKATLVDGEWNDIESMPFNSDEYNVAHPALSLDETKLYFASDMPGTLGNSDIFVVDINEDGTYGEPKNLGNKVNTEGRENFPYISNNGTLYFSSDGRPGLGGLDIFMKRLDDAKAEAINLAKPINSSRDDFEFIIDEFTNIGYLTSNRLKGKGDDDIYKFKREFCTKLISGTTINKETNEIIEYASVAVVNEKGIEVKNLTSDKNGVFSYEADCKKQTYKVIVSKDGFIQETIKLKIKPNDNKDVVLKLNLTPDTSAASVGKDLFKLLDLKPIYFDYDKSNIRPDAQIEIQKVIDYLKKYPTVKIYVKSHTDSRGEDVYNNKLSSRRNTSTINWIVEKGGISRSRLSGKGYGETQLVNRCSNNIQCSKNEHQQNRRSEFIITEN